MIQRKLSEDDLTMPVLYILYTRGAMDTSALKRNILAMLNPSGSNLDPLVNRNDTKIWIGYNKLDNKYSVMI